MKSLQKSLTRGRGHEEGSRVPYTVAEEQRSNCEAVAMLLQTHFSSLFANFRTYSLCDRTDMEKPITVFLKDSFLNDQPRSAKPFMTRFLETQLFFQYCDQRLRQIDARPNFSTV